MKIIFYASLLDLSSFSLGKSNTVIPQSIAVCNFSINGILHFACHSSTQPSSKHSVKTYYVLSILLVDTRDTITNNLLLLHLYCRAMYLYLWNVFLLLISQTFEIVVKLSFYLSNESLFQSPEPSCLWFPPTCTPNFCSSICSPHCSTQGTTFNLCYSVTWK